MVPFGVVPERTEKVPFFRFPYTYKNRPNSMTLSVTCLSEEVQLIIGKLDVSPVHKVMTKTLTVIVLMWF